MLQKCNVALASSTKFSKKKSAAAVGCTYAATYIACFAWFHTKILCCSAVSHRHLLDLCSVANNIVRLCIRVSRSIDVTLILNLPPEFAFVGAAATAVFATILRICCRLFANFQTLYQSKANYVRVLIHFICWQYRHQQQPVNRVKFMSNRSINLHNTSALQFIQFFRVLPNCNMEVYYSFSK